MGGGEYPETKRSTEYVKSSPGLDARILNPSPLTLPYPACYACAIQLEDDLVLTGLKDNIKDEVKVVKYKINGSQKELPDLNDKRTKHGCSSFTKDNSANKVTKKIIHSF